MSKHKEEQGPIPERLLKILHDEYDFSSVVTVDQREWWFNMALRYVQTWCLVFDEMVAI